LNCSIEDSTPAPETVYGFNINIRKYINTYKFLQHLVKKHSE